MNDQHFLRITPFPAEGVPPLPILGFSERASPQRKTELGLETGTCQEAQKTCCSTGRSQTAPGGPSGKGPPSTRCSGCPLVHVCTAHPGRNSTPGAGEVVILPPRGQGMFLTLCVLCLRLGLLSISFLRQIFVDFLLCPHPSSPSCQGRQA